ncbi:ribosome maturation factor RimP [Corynebacterium alimapuense]|uniref:Ribosome maturation factor RimP n=1 Tax=Corynebacterium alimapuense TaxID=1576874 RepID=A0A3M8KA22_9CORY|nr:ribosome maturation factor RimP [Corynebacterium alimapuense]RNE49382.1 ribosome maturation factor RimP [Corynebacterium alimapuense]
MAFPSVEELSHLIAPVVSSHGLDIEAIKITRAGKKSVVSIRLDADDRPDLDKIEVLAQEISELLDAAEAANEVNLGAGYTLEVSTPGVDLPLTAPRHWRRNRHRLVTLSQDGQSSTWRIGALSAEEDSVILVRTEKKQRLVEVHELADPVSAVVEIEFAKTPEAELELTGLDFELAMTWREDHK